MQVLKETVDLNWSKNEFQEMSIILKASNQVKHNLNRLDFQSTPGGKTQYSITINKLMGNHVQYFACVLPYQPNYLCVLWVSQGVIHSEMVVCFSNLMSNLLPQVDLVFTKCSHGSSYLNLKKWENIAEQNLGL